ncbi:hypothetical protein PPL_02357 [Heterostelium album PN500]|uniref:CBS domain-containing protein n=1 Tax=Heterostelium pallidum (strain ATCC 26659 / Pp 5 / PN500) TaxID=670386 RepID=D3B230_HETP5|nr:hypothetical protein PPL_02357 [Heterostelium album PN500]EFA85354.1 hypothetical protein PPL_02357 [Heterostelium album PN500]|eukprot:XP_020437463.1 hypothetical protein PPL_02357 [Heterostelium album PN500]
MNKYMVNISKIGCRSSNQLFKYPNLQNNLGSCTYLKTSNIQLSSLDSNEKSTGAKKSLYEYKSAAKEVLGTETPSTYFVFGDTKIKEILEKKEKRELLTINSDQLIIEALRKMTQNKVGAIMVLDSNGQLEGIFTERDYVGKVALQGLSSRQSLVKEVMTRGVKTISADSCVVDTMHIMTNQRFRHLPVVDKESNKVLGMVSIQDLIRSVHDNQKETIKYLREFLSDANSYSYNKNPKK